MGNTISQWHIQQQQQRFFAAPTLMVAREPVRQRFCFPVPSIPCLYCRLRCRVHSNGATGPWKIVLILLALAVNSLCVNSINRCRTFSFRVLTYISRFCCSVKVKSVAVINVALDLLVTLEVLAAV